MATKRHTQPESTDAAIEREYHAAWKAHRKAASEEPALVQRYSSTPAGLIALRSDEPELFLKLRLAAAEAEHALKLAAHVYNREHSSLKGLRELARDELQRARLAYEQCERELPQVEPLKSTAAADVSERIAARVERSKRERERDALHEVAVRRLRIALGEIEYAFTELRRAQSRAGDEHAPNPTRVLPASDLGPAGSPGLVGTSYDATPHTVAEIDALLAEIAELENAPEPHPSYRIAELESALREIESKKAARQRLSREAVDRALESKKTGDLIW